MERVVLVYLTGPQIEKVRQIAVARMFKGYFEYPEGYPWKLPKFVLGCPTSLRKKPVVCMQNKRIKQLKPFSEELREQKNGEVKQHDKENRT